MLTWDKYDDVFLLWSFFLKTRKSIKPTRQIETKCDSDMSVHSRIPLA